MTPGSHALLCDMHVSVPPEQMPRSRQNEHSECDGRSSHIRARGEPRSPTAHGTSQPDCAPKADRTGPHGSWDSESKPTEVSASPPAAFVGVPEHTYIRARTAQSASSIWEGLFITELTRSMSSSCSPCAVQSEQSRWRTEVEGDLPSGCTF